MKTVLSATHLIAAGVIAGAFAIGFFTGPALASEPQAMTEKFEFPFQYDRSELASPEAAKAMLGRMERKVRQHCAAPGRRQLAESDLVSQCIDRTMSKAVERFGSATLAEAYKSRTGG